MISGYCAGSAILLVHSSRHHCWKLHHRQASQILHYHQRHTGTSTTTTTITVTAALLQPRFLTRNYSAESLEAMKELDSVLAQLAVRILVYLLCNLDYSLVY